MPDKLRTSLERYKSTNDLKTNFSLFRSLSLTPAKILGKQHSKYQQDQEWGDLMKEKTRKVRLLFQTFPCNFINGKGHNSKFISLPGKASDTCDIKDSFCEPLNQYRPFSDLESTEIFRALKISGTR